MGARVGELFGGEVHVLVNNAGYNGKCQLVRDMALADWDHYDLTSDLEGNLTEAQCSDTVCL